jgi:Fe-S cluster biogenesis protein NfuA
MAHLMSGDLEERVYTGVEQAQEQFRAEDTAMLSRENLSFLDDDEYASMLGQLAGTYKGVEVAFFDPFTKTVELEPEGGCAACAVSSFHIQRAIGTFLVEHVDPDLRVIVRSSPQTDF